jgi:hypothetical protein
VVVWTILAMSATLGIVGIVGLLHECWTSARASEASHSNEAQTQQLHHADFPSENAKFRTVG